jgi:hypothetical protein
MNTTRTAILVDRAGNPRASKQFAGTIEQISRELQAWYFANHRDGWALQVTM